MARTGPVAVAEVEGAEAGLALVDALDLGCYYLFHAIRADLLSSSAGLWKRGQPTSPLSR